MAFIKDSPAAIIPDTVHAEIRTAINIKNALDRIRRLPQLGYCPTKVQQFRHRFQLDDDQLDDQFDDEDDEDDEYFRRRDEERPETRFSTRDLTNQVCKYLVQVCRAHPPMVSSIFGRPS